MEPQQQRHLTVIQSGGLCKAQDREYSRKLAFLSLSSHFFSASSLHPHLLLHIWKSEKIKLALFLSCEFLRIECKNAMQSTRVWCRSRAITNCVIMGMSPHFLSLVWFWFIEQKSRVPSQMPHFSFSLLPSGGRDQHFLWVFGWWKESLTLYHSASLRRFVKTPLLPLLKLSPQGLKTSSLLLQGHWEKVTVPSASQVFTGLGN